MQKVTWADLTFGDTVYIDNYEDGKFPNANPKISGPYTVKHVGNRTLQTIGKTLSNGYPLEKTFLHYPNNLLRG